MSKFTMTSNVNDAIAHMQANVARALEIVGGKAETYAAALAPVDSTGISGANAGALRQSIGHAVDENKVSIGSSQAYAPYVELGTGPLYEPPPEWIEAHARRGRGLDHWIYKGGDGKWHVGYPRAGVHFLTNAINNHMEEYKAVIKNELSK